MKQLFLSFALFGSLAVMAQSKPAPAKKPAAKTATNQTLKTMTDSASYAVGVMAANFYKQQGITNINSAVVAKAINDVIANKTPLLSNEDANDVMMRYINKAQLAKSAPNIKAGEAFLATNKAKAG